MTMDQEPPADDDIAGQLIDSASADVTGLDDEKDAVASAVGQDAAYGEDVSLSAEEAAMHVTDSP